MPKMASKKFMRRERRRLQARHICMEIEPQWSKIEKHLYQAHYKLPCKRLFLNEFTEGSR